MTQNNQKSGNEPGSSKLEADARQGRSQASSGAAGAVRNDDSATAKAGKEMRSTAEQVTQTVASGAASYAQQARSAAADETKSVASALRTAAGELRSGSAQERTFSQLADGLADASEALRDKDLGQAMSEINAFARRNPLMFLGGAALLGFAATRFAKATSSAAHRAPGGSDAFAGRASPAGANPRPTGSPSNPTTAMGDTI